MSLINIFCVIWYIGILVYHRINCPTDFNFICPYKYFDFVNKSNCSTGRCVVTPKLNKLLAIWILN